jgi:hypothetical protein
MTGLRCGEAGFGLSTATMFLRERAVVAAMSLACAGCSIAMLDVPRSGSPGQSEPWRRGCRKAPAWTLVDIGLGVGAAGLAVDVFALSSDPGTRGAGQIGGWVLLSTFAASAIYGGYVTARCHSAAPGNARRAEQARQLASPKLAGFPEAVLQFQFGATMETVARACVAGGAGFEAGQGHSVCRSPARSLARPDARLEFQGGPLSRVTLVYPTTPETLRTTLAQIHAQAVSYYGQPRSGPNAWSSACASNGAVQCLKDGELPGRAFWSFVGGGIELRPAIEGEGLSVELRYTRYDPER